MGYNKIPLALKFNDDTGNAEGLIEFQLNVSDIGDICDDNYNPSPGDVLTYDSDLNCWTASATPAVAAGALSALTDVCGDTPSDYQALVWNGSAWCPSTIPTGGGGGAVNSVNTETGDVSLALDDIYAVNSTVFNSGGSLNVPTASVVVGAGGGSNTTITGSTGQLSVTNNSVTTTIYPGGYINLPNITAATTLTEEGDIGYDQDSNTFVANVGTQDLLIHMGEDQLIQTYNDTGTSIGSGLAVYVSGSVGDRLAITLADKDTNQETQRILGVTTRDFDGAGVGRNGFIQTFGKLDMDTRTIVGAAEEADEGSPVFVGDSGALTLNKPTLPTESVIRIGKLEKYAEDGLLFIDVQHGFVANDLDDVNVDINSVVITDGTASAVSSLSGASGSMVYFDGDTPAPILRTFDNIVSHEGYTIQPGETYLTGIGDGAVDTLQIADDAVTADKLANSINNEIAANTAKVTNATHTGQVTGSTALTIANDVVDPDNLADTGITNGQLIKRSSATQFAGVTTTANSETFLGTNANLGNLTDCTSIGTSPDNGVTIRYNDGTGGGEAGWETVQLFTGGTGTDLDVSTINASGNVTVSGNVITDGLTVTRVGQGRPTAFRWETDYLSPGVNQNGWGSHTNGTGAGIGGHWSNMINGTDYGVGVVEVRSGTATSGRASMTTFQNVFVASAMGVSMAGRVTMSGLWSSGTNDGFVIFGVGDNTNNATDPSRGVYFKYDHTNANWQAISSKGGTDTTTDTGIGVSAEAFQVLQVMCNDDWNAAQFFIDGSLVATHTLADGHNIPIGSSGQMGLQIRVVNDATNVTDGNELWIDWHVIELTHTRTDRGEDYIKAQLDPIE